MMNNSSSSPMESSNSFFGSSTGGGECSTPTPMSTVSQFGPSFDSALMYEASSASGAGNEGGGGGGADRNGGVRSFMQLSKAYFNYTAPAYTLCNVAIHALKLKWVVFCTAMSYFHIFCGKYGHQRLHPVFLIAGCIFLAAKVEHQHKEAKLDRLANVVFEPTNANERDKYKKKILQVELMVIEALDFNFQVVAPFGRLERHGKDSLVVQKANKLLSYTYISPVGKWVEDLCCCSAVASDHLHPERKLADALVYIAADGLGELDQYKEKLDVSNDIVMLVRRLVIDILFLMGKTCGIPCLDEKVEERKASRTGAAAGATGGGNVRRGKRSGMSTPVGGGASPMP